MKAYIDTLTIQGDRLVLREVTDDDRLLQAQQVYAGLVLRAAAGHTTWPCILVRKSRPTGARVRLFGRAGPLCRVIMVQEVPHSDLFRVSVTVPVDDALAAYRKALGVTE